MCTVWHVDKYKITFKLVINSRFVLLTQYCVGDKIEKNEMGWACGAYE